MVIDQEHQHGPPSAADLEAAADFVGQDGGAVDVLADVFCTSGIVEDEGQVERVGILDVVQQLAVELTAGVLLVELIGQAVEHIDTAQGVFVSGVAVEELVLHKAVHRAKLGQVVVEHLGAVHETKDASDFSFSLQNGPECLSVFGVVAE